MRLRETVAECLRSSPGIRMKAREVANWIFEHYPDQCHAKLERSDALKTEGDLLQQLVAEIGANRLGIVKKFPQIKTTEGRPRLYYWSILSDEEEAVSAASAEISNNIDIESADHEEDLNPKRRTLEADLYPKLANFLKTDSDLFCQRIDEKRSSNRRGPQGNRWLFPDLVAMEDLTSHWSREIRDCVSEARARKFRLWSFEVKILLNRANVRECYFQTVSNSSWANFGYLVAGEINGSDTMKELRMLSSLHGIGVIRLDRDTPADSEVLIPARERQDIDWANCDRLAEENSDFMEVIKRVWAFHRTGSVISSDWKA